MNSYSLYTLSAVVVGEAFGSNFKTQFEDLAPNGAGSSVTILKDYYVTLAKASNVTATHHQVYLNECEDSQCILNYFKYYIIPDILKFGNLAKAFEVLNG